MKLTSWFFSLIGLVFPLFVGSAAAVEWQDHAPPFDFLFGNEIDDHQETQLGPDGALTGTFYVILTGAIDPASGLPVARHPRGAAKNEVCGVDVDCVEGWKIRAVPGAAEFLYHSGVNGDDHPVWLVNRVDIPQPGYFSHFHWIGADSTDVRAAGVPPECDVDKASQLEGGMGGTMTTSSSSMDSGSGDGTGGGSGGGMGGATGLVCPGWFLQIEPDMAFAFEHGGELVPVRSEFDTATHWNLLTNYRTVSGVTPTR